MRALAGPLLIGVLLAAGTVAAHEHMYVASTKNGGGGLVLVHDFARAFPLVLLPSTGQYIGNDPSYNSLVADDPGQGLYRLPEGVRVVMEMTALDPGVSVLLGSNTLDSAGDKATVGTMPYLHVHPQWTLAPGLYGSAFHLSFRVKATGYTASPVYTAAMTNTSITTTTLETTTSTLPDGVTTTTITPGGSTTTTTLASCTPGSCEDLDPCTDDTCDGPACMHTAVEGGDAVLCRLERFASALADLPSDTRAQQRVVTRLFRAVGKAREAIQAMRAGQGQSTKLTTRAERALDRLVTQIDAGVRRGRIAPVTGEALRAIASDAFDAFALWKASL